MQDLKLMAPHISFKVMDHYVDCMLVAFILHNTAKNRGDHLDARNKINILLKTLCQVDPATFFVVKHTIESFPV